MFILSDFSYDFPYGYDCVVSNPAKFCHKKGQTPRKFIEGAVFVDFVPTSVLIPFSIFKIQLKAASPFSEPKLS